ncbi:hypothetical protein FGO68_gene9342 [Halteria grandinella]|uniref:Uncharacterized protein n=1 Tax=Halteria grandinella TaxID=5974 RepID=A0A8J8P252_HALGN|nr:hypothetical protein FGO68_gene9342 [Halteria grandinella]
MLSQRTNEMLRLQNRNVNPEQLQKLQRSDLQRILAKEPTTRNNFQSLEGPLKFNNTITNNLSQKRGSVPQSATNPYQKAVIKSATGSLGRDPYEKQVINPQAIIYGKLLQKNQKNKGVQKVNNYVDLS